MKFFFRLDASPVIGLGHARRCAVLAEALMKMGHQAVFALRLKDVSDLPLPVGADCEVLPWNDIAEDLIDFCTRHQTTCGVVDHYRQTEDYQRSLLAAGLKWMQFYNPSLNMPFHGHLLHHAAADPSMALVAPAFAQQRQIMPPWEQREDILITFGGGDDRGGINAALDLLDAARWSGKRIILTTSLNPRLKNIRGGEIIVDDFSPAPRMAQCKAAICAGGTTLFELATLGIPAFIITIADNQLHQARIWEKNQLGTYLGSLGGALKPLEDSHLRMWSDRCLSIVDGQGATRTAEALINLSQACP
jgi:spore coat polysaccharide biosynthesis predicted glycosyltransferase SpsG